MDTYSRNIYLDLVLRRVPLILSQLDRRPGSPTAGCFDREYWHHRCVDFPCMEKQEAVLGLALLYTINHPDNPYYGQPNIQDWVACAVEFWCRAQRSNGSFDEWYPYENSMTATAFSTQCITEAMLLTGDHVDWRPGITRHVERAAAWLARHQEHAVCNQEAGAALALENCARVTGREEFRLAADRKLEALLALQDDEGWFPEYGGADVGYSSVTLAYLAQLWRHRREHERLLGALEKLVTFLAHFVHRDHSLGGCYGSRQTEYLLPLGPELLAPALPEAARLAARLRRALSARKDLGLANVDHRYLLFHNYFYLQAYAAAAVEVDDAPGARENFDLPRAGLRGFGTREGHIVVAARKGGAFKTAAAEGSLTDCGWTVVKDERVWISSHFIPGLEASGKVGRWEVSGRLLRVSASPLGTAALVLLRLLTATLGRVEPGARLLKQAARAFLVTGGRRAGPRHRRVIECGEEGLAVSDRLEGVSPEQRVYLGGSFSYAVGPSTRTYRAEQLGARPLCFSNEDLSAGTLEVERKLSWNGTLRSLKINGKERAVE